MNTKTVLSIMLLPALILLLLVLIYPLFMMVRLALTDTNGFNLLQGGGRYVGLQNFQLLFNDDLFIKALFNTAVFSVVTTALQLILGLTLALLIFPIGRIHQAIVTALLLIPTMSADIAISLNWKALLAFTGPINTMLERFSVQPVAWLGEPALALWIIIGISVWQWTPYMYVFSLAGLESLPKSYHDTLRIEGASTWQGLFMVLLPSIMPILGVALFFRLAEAVRVFDKVYVLTGGGPGTASEVLSTYLQRLGFAQLQLGLASAGGVVMTLLAAIIAAGATYVTLHQDVT